MFSFAVYTFKVDLEILWNIRYNPRSIKGIYICIHMRPLHLFLFHNSTGFAIFLFAIYQYIFWLRTCQNIAWKTTGYASFWVLSPRENVFAYYVHITCKMNNKLHTLYLLLVAKRHFIQSRGYLSNLKTNILKS